jgi:hypothetical protein
MSAIGLCGRRLALVLLGVGLAVSRVAAHQSPGNCNGNGVGLSARGNEYAVDPGGTVTYQIAVSNLDDTSIGLVACDADDIDLVFYCPGADGKPDFTNPTVITTNLSLPFGTSPTPIGAPSCVMNVSPGVVTATTRFRLGDQAAELDNLSEGSAHVATFDQPFRRDQFILTEIPGNVAPTTTSTIPTVCGNGVREGAEECDPGPTDTECCSVSLGCFTFKPNLNRPCGEKKRPSLCFGDVCTDDGECRTTNVAADPPVRCRTQSDVCDLGDFCDGTSVDCPTSHQCKADLAASADATSIEVSCDAPLTDGTFECSAMGFAPARRSPAGDVEVGACGKRPYTPKASTSLVATGDPEAVHGQLSLALDAAPRRVLRKRGSVRVCVAVSVKLDGIVVKTTRRLITVTK